MAHVNNSARNNLQRRWAMAIKRHYSKLLYSFVHLKEKGFSLISQEATNDPDSELLVARGLLNATLVLIYTLLEDLCKSNRV